MFRTIFIHIPVVFTLVLLIKNYELTKDIILQAYLLFIPFDLLWRLLLLYRLKNIRIATDHYRTAIILGSGKMAKQINSILQTHKGYGYKVQGIFDDTTLTGNVSDLKITGDLMAAQTFCLNQKIEDIFCTLPLTDTEKITDMISFAEKHLIRYKIVPDFSALHNKPFAIDYYGFVPVISPVPEPLDNFINNSAKRLFDILFSLLVIVFLLSWLIPIVGILLLLESKGSVFYRQNRSGLNYKTLRKCIFEFLIKIFIKI